MRGSWNHELDQWHTEIDTLALSLCLHYGRLPPSLSLSLRCQYETFWRISSLSPALRGPGLSHVPGEIISALLLDIFSYCLYFISPFFLRDQQILDVCDCDCLFVCQYCIIVSEAMQYLSLFFSYAWLQFKAAHILRSGSQIHHMWHHWLQISAKVTLQLS